MISITDLYLAVDPSFNSPGHVDPSFDSPGHVSPTNQGPLRGLELGRRLLKADGYSKRVIKSIEQLLITSNTSDTFVQETMGSTGMSAEKALLVWDLYKLV